MEKVKLKLDEYETRDLMYLIVTSKFCQYYITDKPNDMKKAINSIIKNLLKRCATAALRTGLKSVNMHEAWALLRTLEYCTIKEDNPYLKNLLCHVKSTLHQALI